MKPRFFAFSKPFGGWMAFFLQGAVVLVSVDINLLGGVEDGSPSSSSISRGGGGFLVSGVLAATGSQTSGGSGSRSGAEEPPTVSVCSAKPNVDSISLTLDESHKQVYFDCGQADTTQLTLDPSNLKQVYGTLDGECHTTSAVDLADALPTATLQTYKTNQGYELSVKALPTDSDKLLCLSCADASKRALCKVMITAKRSAPQPPRTCVGDPASILLDAEGNASLSFHCSSKYSQLDPVEEGLEYVNTDGAQCNTRNRLDTVLPGASLQELPPPTPPYSNVWKSFQLSLKGLPKEKQELCYRCKNPKGETCDVLIQVPAQGSHSTPSPNNNSTGGASGAHDRKGIDSALTIGALSLVLVVGGLLSVSPAV